MFKAKSSNALDTSEQGFWCEHALLDGTVEPGVLIKVKDGTITSVNSTSKPPRDATRLTGLTIPGLANTHSHAFHRALRGRTHEGTGSFWTWREQMYEVAQKLTPDSYYQLARAVYGEMVLAGITAVGEFHYVHHQPDGTPYEDPNAMGFALFDAAADAGIRIALLDTAYLHGGIATAELVAEAPGASHLPVNQNQRRFSDGTVDTWLERMNELLEDFPVPNSTSPNNTSPDSAAQEQRGAARELVGAAIHSVRALTVTEMERVGRFAAENSLPLHVHLSETTTENHECQQAFGVSPTGLLDQAQVLSPRLTAVHATHMSEEDIALLARSGSNVCMCPTTERDLADGIGPSTRFAASGIEISLGSDSHAVIDLLEEARAVELDERLLSNVRGNHSVHLLAEMASENGYRALGWRGGKIQSGHVADFISVRLDSVRTAGSTPQTALASVIYGANTSDVDSVIVGGELIVEAGKHKSIDVAAELATSIRGVLP